MANKEFTRQSATWRAHQLLGTASPNDVNPFLHKLTPEEINRFKRRWTPRVRAAMDRGLAMLERGIEDKNLMLAYIGSVEYATASIYGERAVEAINWEKPPVIDTPEQRYLVVLSNLGESFREGRHNDTRRMMKGLTVYYGSNADSGGFPCNPEVLFSLITAESNLQTIFETCPPTSEDGKLGYRVEDQIIEMVQGYSIGDRSRIAQATVDFGEVTDSYLRHRQKEGRFASIHPLLGQLAHRVIPTC